MEFDYVARDPKSGKKVKGVFSANSQLEVIHYLKKNHLLPVHVAAQPIKRKSFESVFQVADRVKPKDIVFFTRQMSATLNAGLNLSEALEVVCTDLNQPYFKDVMSKIRMNLLEGNDLSSSLSAYPDIFDSGYVAIIKVGEVSGTLKQTFQNLADYLERVYLLKEKVKSSMMYPVFLFWFSTAIILLIVVFLVPQFESMFQSSGVELPLITIIVTNTSKFIIEHYVALIGAVIFLAISLKIAMRFPYFQNLRETIMLHIPIVGPKIIHKSLVTRFCRTFSVMIGAGITMHNCLNVLKETIDHTQLKDIVNKITDRVLAGENLSDEFKRHKFFPLFLSKMVLIGERTGRLDAMFSRAADYFDSEVDNSIRRATVLIEPIMLVVIGMFIAAIVLSLYLPIFSSMRLIQ